MRCWRRSASVAPPPARPAVARSPRVTQHPASVPLNDRRDPDFTAPSLRSDPDDRPPAAVRTVDRTLNVILLAAERDMQMAMTVSAGGGVVSGTLVSTSAYYRTLADQFASAEGGTDMDELFAEAFRGIIDDARRASKAALGEWADGAGREPALEYLHMTDARYVSGSAFLPHGRQGVLWRCRAADVSGWSLGDLMLG